MSVPLMPPDPNNPPIMPVAAPVSPPVAPQVSFPVSSPAAPSMPGAYGTVPPPSQPLYGTLPPSQPLYGGPPSQQQFYAAPPTMPVSPQVAGSSALSRLLGPNGVPGIAQPYSRVQAMMMRNLSAATAVNPWLTAAIGAIGALVVGLILTWLGGTLWSNALTEFLHSPASSGPNSSASLLGSFTTVAQQALTPDLLKLFALAHHVSLNISAAASTQTGSSAGGTLALNVPLTGLFLAPALALTLGGYISAGSDFTRLARYSIARGALIAPFYAVLLAICALLGSSTLSGSPGSELLGPVSGTVTIAPSVGEALLYGLLWGAIFGALGGWIHVSGHFWLSTALATLRTARNGKVAGALAGAVAALATGIVLFGVAYIGLATYSGIAGMASSSATTGPTTSIVTTLTLYLLFAPVIAVYGFALAAGAPIGIFGSDSASHTTSSISISLLNGYQMTLPQSAGGGPILPHFPPSPVYYVLILGALISYLVGGHVAARVARANGAGGLVAGALMAVPLSLFLTFAAYLATFGLSFDVAAGGQGGTFATAVSPAYGGVFLAVLVGGAVFGGIGGAMPWLGAVPRALLLPFRPFGKLLAPLLDGIMGRNRQQPPSLAMRWVYDGVGVALVFIVLAVAADVLNSAAPTLIPFAVLWQVEGVVAALLVALPLACFFGALLAAFTSPAPLAPPPMQSPMVVPPSVPMYATVPASMPASVPGMYAPSMPLPPYPGAPAPQQPATLPPLPDYGTPGPGTPPPSL